ncbi:neuron navigator 1 isoform X2 [Patagioenas fasciata]|uniref:neuron navigator 1 isoform X2 n=1 Tax=Patagioenas fasciata TaxID=372321 RepID=UPI003A99CE50
MNGTANVSPASRSHYVSAIPVPRAVAHAKPHAAAPPSAPGLPVPHRTPSPQPAKALAPGPKTLKPKGAGRAEGREGSPGGPPRGGQRPPVRAPVSPGKWPEAAGSRRRGAGVGEPTELPKAPPVQSRGGGRLGRSPGKAMARMGNEPHGGSQGRSPVFGSGAITFSSGPPHSHPVTATVAPFQYRLQEKPEEDGATSPGDKCPSPAEGPDPHPKAGGLTTAAAPGGLNGCSAGMLGSNLKSLPDVELGEEERGYRRGPDGGAVMPKRAKSAAAPAAPRGAELRVFKASSAEGRLPAGSNLRKQKSLTNLAFLTDAEKKRQLYEPRWSDDMAKAAATGAAAGGGGRGGGGPRGREAPAMSRSLSRSEHSLLSPRPAGPAKPPPAGKPSRIPRGPYAEVKPLSKAPEAGGGGGGGGGKCDDELLGGKGPAVAAGAEEKPYLKVDPELVVTVLGDLEQLLFSQMLDPESQRKRTVQNVLDLRQNLEETMSSLRGSQVSHSSLEMTCYDSDEANPRSVSSLSNRSSPLSWRYGQSSPRLQAGDAPSVGGTCRSEGTPSWYMHGERAHYSHTMPMRSPSKLSHISRLELVEALDTDDVELKSGYMSDSDLMGKTLTEDDDITTGWDESSSISSGLSDASDNLSSEEFNASSSLNSLPSTPTASRRNSAIALRTDSEKRSLAESGLSWYGEGEDKAPKKLDYESSSLKMEHGSKWRREPSEGGEEGSKGGELKKPVSLGTPGSLKKGKTPPVAVTSPITHTAQSTLKVAAGKPETKGTDKSKLSVKSTGLQRSSSDAGRDRIADAKKPPSGLTRPSASSSFGYKKPAPTTGTATVMQTGGSATLGKIQKSSGIPVKPVSGRKTSLDVSNAAEPGFLAPGARSNIQYRSLPRPAKSSSMSVTGGRGANRPVSSSIDPSLLSTKQGGISVSRLKEPSKISAGRGTPAPVNQTDREKEKAKAKAVALDSECGTLKSISSPESTPKAQANLPPAAKVAELPPTPLRAAAKTYVKPPSLANLDKVNSNSLDLPSSSELHPPHAAKLQDLHPAGGHLAPCFSPSPAPILNINSASFSQGLELMGGFSVPKEGRMYPKLSGLHRSMESLQMPMSLPSAFSGGSTTTPAPAAVPSASTEEEEEEEAGELGWSGSPRLAHLDSASRDRNTLPKKGLRYQLHSQEEAKERRHSHAVGSGLPEAEDQQDLPSPPALPMALVGKGPLTSIVSPTAAAAPRITRSNSIPTHDSTFELYSTSQLGSTLSLADKSKGMIRSGSFRDPVDDVHGSVLSLASSASSTYSSAEEKMQSEQIRKLRRELESSQEKVATLTSQLSANANLVAAFEQSLVSMTSRLRHLAETAEEKDTELLDLRETIDFLKKKNSEAQAVIQGALNGTDVTPKELRIKRQNSSDSISSLNSITSHSSIGSSKDADAKKKKKKSWLRSSFNKAFSIKKGPKSASSYSDIEEIATPDSSAPSSPKLQHGSTETASPSIKSSTSSSVGIDTTELFQAHSEGEPEKKEVSELRSELWEKEMKLTDIRLEALNSAHQLEQLRETMHNMQLEVDLLKAENDRLKVAPGPSAVPGSVPGHVTSTSASSSPRRSLGLALGHGFSPSLGDTDVSPMDAVSAGTQKDELMLRIVVRMPPQHIIKGDLKQQEFFLGWTKVSGKVDWKMLDEAVCQVFKDYITKMDPASTLGLSTESVYGYSISHIKRILDTEPPELPLCRRGLTSIVVTLKGLKEKCVDSLVFETLIPKPMMQHYISLLLKHRRLILSGPSGTGKTYLTNRLAEYLVERSGRDVTEGIVSTFNMHQQSCKDLQLYLSNLANQIDRETGTADVPLVILLDDLSEAGSISELVNGALTCKYHKCPYIIGTTNQPVKMTPNHGLHLSFRMLTFSNNVEPANGFLVRYLRRKLLESDTDVNANKEELLRVLDWVPKLWYHLHTFLEKHSTSDFLIGPCFFLSCPIGIEDFRTWFIDLWNNSIIPYLQEGAKDGLKVHGQKAAWEDPVEWVRDTLPWPSAQQDQSKLYHLPPPTIGPHSTVSPPEERTVKDTTPSSLDADPLMAMLLKLQEAANYIESPDRETMVDPDLQSTL